jgi:hypothetical protein
MSSIVTYALHEYRVRFSSSLYWYIALPGFREGSDTSSAKSVRTSGYNDVFILQVACVDVLTEVNRVGAVESTRKI